MPAVLRHRPATAALGVFVAAVSLILTALPAPAESAFPGRNGKIVFVSNRDGNLEIYTMNADGTGQTRRTNNTPSDFQPAWSADGSKIAFAVPGGDDEIYTMNADGTGRTMRAGSQEPGSQPAWSPDGTKIAFESNRDGNLEIYTMNADGTGQIRRTNNTASDSQPAWSPDGTKIAFQSNRNTGGSSNEIFTMNADGTGQTKLSAGFDSSPAWSPDGTKIAFMSDRDQEEGGFGEIYTMNADGTGQTNRTNTVCGSTCAIAATEFDPAWSPDGTKIAFVSTRDGNDEIYTMNADGTGQTRVTNNSTSDSAPDWQPLSYQHPKSTVPINVGLVPVMRQTISAAQCSARGGTPTNHAAPFAVTSCDPPTPVVGTSAYFGSEGVGSATITPVAGNPITLGDEADYAFSASLTDVRAGNLEGADYNPDMRLVVRLRISDKLNCAPPGCSAPYYRPGTATDLDFGVPMNCSDTADPAIGATCAANTTADAVTPGAVTESRQTVTLVNRVRINDAGLDQISGNADDRLFAIQGIFVP